MQKQELIHKLRKFGADFQLQDKPLSVIREWDMVFKHRYPEYRNDLEPTDDIWYLKPDPSYVCEYCGGGIWGFRYYGEPFFCICDDILRINQAQAQRKAKSQHVSKFNPVLNQFMDVLYLDPDLFKLYIQKKYPDLKTNVTPEMLNEFHSLSARERYELYQERQKKKNNQQ